MTTVLPEIPTVQPRSVLPTHVATPPEIKIFTLLSDEHQQTQANFSSVDWKTPWNYQQPLSLVMRVEKKRQVTFLVHLLFRHCWQAQRFHELMKAVVSQALSIHEVKHDWAEQTELFQVSSCPTAGLTDAGVKLEDIVSQRLVPEHLLHYPWVRQDTTLQPPQS